MPNIAVDVKLLAAKKEIPGLTQEAKFNAADAGPQSGHFSKVRRHFWKECNEVAQSMCNAPLRAEASERAEEVVCAVFV
jgi:hypothetical protein